MSKIDPVEPVSVTYSLRDIFNYLQEHIIDLEAELELAEQSEQDATLKINCTKSALETKRSAIKKVSKWLDKGIECAETDAVFSDANILRYIQSESICAQIASGQLRPNESRL